MLPKHPRLHVSIPSVLSSVLIAGAAQCLVLSLRDPVGRGLGAVINWFLKRGHYDVMFLPQQDIWWTLSIGNLVLFVIFAMLGLMLANWTLQKRQCGRSSKIVM